MPHIQIEYTANLEGAVVGGGLVEAIHQAAVDSGIFPVWGIRTVARAVSHYRVGNGDTGNGFVQVGVRIAPGRNLALRQRIAQELFSAFRQVMAGLFKTHRLGCQLEVTEFDADVCLYQNNLAASRDAAEPLVCRPVQEVVA
ncbi:5-carboxymethyl-2-hydroxymuconate Delta-isomerase [Polaromonas jejuensis]|uniref:5-carboxymethyl-2-hydroxymuconate Delta-isomerase n=1 Tax=Polaromonas jejuensis TaxID=457502 RepID=A0ABW0QB91_9BURK|nr:5-carboxymethyl-2-hydroxymuconate Delta-isomerase [Polaromonas jejuensis]